MRSLKIQKLVAWQNIVFTKISLTQLIDSLMTILRRRSKEPITGFFFHFDVKWRSSSFPAAGAGKY